MKAQAARSSKMSAKIYQTTRRYVPEDSRPVFKIVDARLTKSVIDTFKFLSAALL
jgi:hypothetical protein